MVDFEQKDKYSVADLLRIMEILRAPDGCMWDRGAGSSFHPPELHRGDL